MPISWRREFVAFDGDMELVFVRNNERWFVAMQVQRQEADERLSVRMDTGMQSSREMPEAVVGNDVEMANGIGGTLRVTPEEVALAVAALEAKRDASHRLNADTVPLEEAIHQLGLNASPQELETQVVAIRAERAARTEVMKRQRHGVLALVWLGFTMLLGVAFAYCLTHLPFLEGKRTEAHAMTNLPIQKLATVADNVPVHIDSDTLLGLATGTVAPDGVAVDTRAESDEFARFNNEWTLVKSGGELFVQGWATAESALAISNDSTGSIFSGQPQWVQMSNLVPIQVPVYRLEMGDFVRYLPDGKRTETGATSVMLATNVADSVMANKDLISNTILCSDANYYDSYSPGKSHVSVKIDNGVVHLTGNATSARLKQRAGEVATSVLRRLHLSDRISNEVTVDAPGE